MHSDYSLGACIWCLHSAHTNLSSHTGRHKKQVLYSAAGNAKYILKNYNNNTFTPASHHDRYNSPSVQYHCSFLLSPWTLFILFTFFFSLGDRSLNSVFFPSYVGVHPTAVSTRLISSGRACLGMPAHHACSTYVLSLHPRFNLRSRLLPITQFPCRSVYN